MRQLFYLTAVILLCFGMSGCGRDELPPERREGSYKIYYLNSSRTKLTNVDYETETTDQETLIGELAGQLLVSSDNPDYHPAIGEKALLLDMKKEDNVLFLNFNKDYTAMKPTREILCRAALAKTFTQVEGIDYISINCDGQPLLDRQGNPVGAFSASDFVESISDVNSFERVELKLYFANKNKDMLLAENREVVHNINTSLERLVVEQLIAGSQTGGGAVLPKDTRILNVSLTDNTCYVNLDSAFLNGEVDAADYIPVYALVNSLTELQTVNKVQITVNGSADVLYRNVISLSAPLEREEKYVES